MHFVQGKRAIPATVSKSVGSGGKKKNITAELETEKCCWKEAAAARVCYGSGESAFTPRWAVSRPGLGSSNPSSIPRGPPQSFPRCGSGSAMAGGKEEEEKGGLSHPGQRMFLS